jgi:hypothetical protein
MSTEVESRLDLYVTPSSQKVLILIFTYSLALQPVQGLGFPNDFCPDISLGCIDFNIDGILVTVLVI